jgi:signal transduction histidine kinase
VPSRYRWRVVMRRWALVALDVPAAAAAMAAVVLMRPVSGWWVWALAALLGLPLAARRLWPVPVLVVVGLAAAAAQILGVGTEVALYAVAFALYPVAMVSARAAILGLTGALAAILVPGVADAVAVRLPVVPVDASHESFSTTPVSVAAYTIAVITGTFGAAWMLRHQRRRVAELAELRTARVVAEERLRIARDIHDVVGHNLSLIAMKAAVANHLSTDRAAALQLIEQVSRTALEDVRTVLNGLRHTDGGSDADELTGTVDMDQLVDQTRATGVAVTVDRDDLSSVPPGIQMSTFRIVQEALTNVRLHAGATRCEVTVRVEPDGLRLAVVDDGTAPRRANPRGHGLLGMRERVAVHGGSVTAGPEPTGGFAVRATLPLPA